MELFLVGVSTILLMLMWRFMLRKTILDHHRDQLFDLRDELRSEFIKNGWGLDSTLYKRLRDLINGYLRFTEDFALTRQLFLEANIKQSPEIQMALKSRFENNFKSISEQEKAFIKKFRMKSLAVISSYMVLSSGPLVILALIMLPMVAIVETLKLTTKSISAVVGKVWRFNVAFSELLRFVVALIARKILRANFIEEYSYRIGHTPTNLVLEHC